VADLEIRSMPILRRGLVASLLFLALCRPVAAQTSKAWADCRPDSLVTWNCARYYSGTVTLSSELKGSGVNDVRSVVADIKAGRVTCRVKATDVLEYMAPGMLAVVHANTGNAGEYEISVWCPESADKPPTRRDSPVIEVMDQQASDYGLLDGKDSHEHPLTDEANGLSGTETITWRLRRE
jgi:hypothetical protein